MEFHKKLFELPCFLVSFLYPKIYYKSHFFVCLFFHYMPSSPIITHFYVFVDSSCMCDSVRLLLTQLAFVQSL